MGALFVTYIYQPFFNILVGLYWLVGRVFGDPDMGIAVILFALVVRIILLPLDFAFDRSEDEKLAISNKIKQLQKEYRSGHHHPDALPHLQDRSRGRRPPPPLSLHARGENPDQSLVS
ncbi:MAG: hypothetical protein UW22_C0085G0003 [Candidatus Gottesmanbacteria bacterium GW2011_GWB1_44_11c]|uniref:Membrane protein insertase YidC n=1 Tax=Candidatus Gottesmanbacteria bacterium GW2011_GWB1_44_11c TaxID=1618447 RepID=A0A0G1IQG2_9BACT|nr:MAG: hypothetical protein UW22_C0085G0003 [Candidatus Gottesmanbacteria bacterium GW2011_GWB1_44_11c]